MNADSFKQIFLSVLVSQREVWFGVKHLCSQICVSLQPVAFDSSAAKTNETWQIEILQRSADAYILYQKNKKIKNYDNNNNN